jgi:HPP family protein
LACAAATAAMALTKTLHPPAGATALLAVVDDSSLEMGWFLIPVVQLGCILMICTALLLNNIQRRYPVYWWTAEDLGKRGQSNTKSCSDVWPESEATGEEYPVAEDCEGGAITAGNNTCTSSQDRVEAFNSSVL